MKNQLPRTVEVVACCGYWVEILAGSRVAGTCISWFRVDLGPIEGMVEMVDVRDIISMMMLCNDIIIIEHDGRRPGLLMHHSIWNMTTTETTEQSTSIALALNIQHNPYNPGTPITLAPLLYVYTYPTTYLAGIIPSKYELHIIGLVLLVLSPLASKLPCMSVK